VVFVVLYPLDLFIEPKRGSAAQEFDKLAPQRLAIAHGTVILGMVQVKADNRRLEVRDVIGRGNQRRLASAGITEKGGSRGGRF